MKKRRKTYALLAVSMAAVISNGLTARADTVKVNASNLNFRTEAGMTAKVIRTLPRGMILDRTADLGEWSQVTVDGVNGFVASRYLQKVQVVSNVIVDESTTVAGREAISGQQILQKDDGLLVNTAYANAAWTVEMKPEYLYAGNSKINSGKSIFYQSNAQKRKEKTICVNAGHGTKGGSSV